MTRMGHVKALLFPALALALAACVSARPQPSYLSSMAAGDGGMTWMGWAPQTGMTSVATSSNPWSDGGWKNKGIQLDPPTASPQEPSQNEEPPSRNHNKKDDEEDYAPGSSRAQASLNAWFPIMLGLFPPQDTRQSSDGQPTASITALANSVNNGSRGVASSHAVAYGGEYAKLMRQLEKSKRQYEETRQYKAPYQRYANNN